jgi:hypothetical protein
MRLIEKAVAPPLCASTEESTAGEAPAVASPTSMGDARVGRTRG